MSKRINVFNLNIGSCNGCAIEIKTLVLNSRIFLSDLAKADILVVSGTVTKTIDKEIEKLHKRMRGLPIIAVGTCCLSRGIFYDTDNLIGTLDEFLPVTVYVFGCPPKPREILQGILMAKRRVEVADNISRLNTIKTDT